MGHCAMHMGNELMSPAVGAGLGVVAAAGLAYAIRKGRQELDERTIPLLGVMGAFVFAAQMLNFPIVPGTSGHLVGGALLAILFGPHLAALCMASIVIIQCLIFQDGGILALGANIVNMALIGPYLGHVGYRLAQRHLRKQIAGPAGAVIAGWVAVAAGALAVPVEVALAGRLAVPFPVFLWTMLLIHAAIGAVEGGITVATIGYVHLLRPGTIGWAAGGRKGIPMTAALGSILIVSLLLAGVVSFYASEHPDGLEKATEDWQMAEQESAVAAAAGKAALFPGYALPTSNEVLRGGRLSVGIAGAAGTIITLGVVFAGAHVVRSRKQTRASARRARF